MAKKKKTNEEIYREQQAIYGSKGGKKTLAIYGKEHFRDIRLGKKRSNRKKK